MTDLREHLQTVLGTSCTLERELGGGGMSRIFLAEDTALGRKIVVKMLPSDTAGAVSVERFKREIRVVAHLQHPHIVPVLSAGQVGELPFYTMPFVKGESLRARLQRAGELSINEAVHVLRDVAAALAYAHSEGVVHRDIKPDNVIVSGGVAVVTDFGVSKAVDVAVTDGMKAPSGITSLGIALGTPAYMAPEQASADPHVDHRADIYSFGCLAYELLAGTSPFAGRTPQQMLSAHVTDVPDPIVKRRPNVTPILASLVMRCLEKRAGDRPQTAEELLNTLDAIATTPSGGSVPTSERLRLSRTPPKLRWIALAGILVVVFVATWVWQRMTTFAPVSVGATIPLAVSAELEGLPSISPDGKLVAYTAETAAEDRIYVRQVDGGRANLLTAVPGGDHSFPKWSPDGSRLSFIANGSIYIVPALGGSPKRIIDNALTQSWTPDGKAITYSTVDGRYIRLHPLDGGSERTLVEGRALQSPAISPNGKVLLYVYGFLTNFTNVSTGAIWSIPVAGGRATRLSDSIHVNASPIWMPDGKSVLFVSDVGGARDVYQLPVNSAGRPRGWPLRLTVGLSPLWLSISADGSRLAYDVVRNFTNIYVAPLDHGVARMADAKPVTEESQHIEGVALSHDGKWISYDSDRGGNFDIYKQALDGGDPIQLTTSPSNEFGEVWSPDDHELAYHSTRNGARDLYVITAEGTSEQQITSAPSEDWLPDWSPDGKSILATTKTPHADTVFVVRRDPSGKWLKPETVIQGGSDVRWARWSPDGKSIAAAIDGDVLIFTAKGQNPRKIMDSREWGLDVLFLNWGGDPSTVYAMGRVLPNPRFFVSGNAALKPGTLALYGIPSAGGRPRLVATDSPAMRFARWQFAIDDKRLFFTRPAWESNVWMMELKR